MIGDAVAMSSPAPQPDRVDPVLRIVGLSKTFPGTRALNSVSMEIEPGEIRALVGANGSGKSTLIKVLAGYHGPDPGSEIWLDGEPLASGSTSHGGQLRFVHQDLGLILQLGAIDNLALRGNYSRHRHGGISWRRQAEITGALLARFGLDLDIYAPLSMATPVQRTVVAIAAALDGWDDSRGGLLVLDEPTAVLPPHEVATLLQLIRDLRDRGASVLYVSHRLDEIFGLADRITVLRMGGAVATLDADSATARQVATLMVGADVEPDYRADVAVPAGSGAAIEVSGARGRYLDGVDFAAEPGEILGFAGLPGSGHDEVLNALAGAVDTATAGQLRLAGETWRPITGLRPGCIPMVPADRGRDGIVAQFSVQENITLATLGKVARGGVLNGRQELATSRRWLKQLSIKTTGPDAPIVTLSGGNQQKVVVARSLERRPPVLVLCEPTAGVDIGSRISIYDLLAGEAARGLTVLVSSSDIGDLLAICTRILIFRDGKVTSQLSGADLTETMIVHAMEGNEQQ